MIIGLTGMIGTGKSTVAAILQKQGCAVFDADKAIHKIHEDENVLAQLRSAFPGTTTREDIMNFVRQNPAQKSVLEGILHPLVKQKRMAFIDAHKNEQFTVLDIPLLFETKASELCDVIWVTHCSPETQEKRVLQRPGFTKDKLATILSWQADHRDKADWVVDTDVPMEDLENRIHDALKSLHA